MLHKARKEMVTFTDLMECRYVNILANKQPPVRPRFSPSAAIFRGLGLFLAMVNKCFELGYFPRVYKVASIKIIPKPGKDDYTRPKSYRPTALLSVLDKTVERMLVGRL
ncbi:RNA-directed DNA polymerase from mobile element jockey [Eumeta japonica]|uniref:RNA-directed DNA polymerase from mobile element jockey n=1 Tax=Eumeta variegata TaxID=151549 RepID=A0A4C1TIE8_EUMVA|nr:RNA-directed DNA polymerase from mobile element jockey [Eumeta japonica]